MPKEETITWFTLEEGRPRNTKRKVGLNFELEFASVILDTPEMGEKVQFAYYNGDRKIFLDHQIEELIPDKKIRSWAYMPKGVR